MAYVKCSNCGEIIDIPPELAPDECGEIMGGYPYFCDACESLEIGETDEIVYYEEELNDDNEPVCSHCGKALEDWSDMGCEYCDTRHPFYGIVP